MALLACHNLSHRDARCTLFQIDENNHFWNCYYFWILFIHSYFVLLSKFPSKGMVYKMPPYDRIHRQLSKSVLQSKLCTESTGLFRDQDQGNRIDSCPIWINHADRWWRPCDWRRTQSTWLVNWERIRCVQIMCGVSVSVCDSNRLAVPCPTIQSPIRKRLHYLWMDWKRI